MGELWGHGRQGWETLETMGECITIRRIALNDIVGTDLHGEKPPPPLLGQACREDDKAPSSLNIFVEWMSR